MFPVVNPWAPGFRRLTGLGQRSLSAVGDAPAAVPASPSSPSGISAGSVGLGLGSAALVLGVSSVGVLFTYGIARESKSGLVKTTGYILAGAATLVALVEAVGIGVIVATKS